jgi:hypothetical protein
MESNNYVIIGFLLFIIIVTLFIDVYFSLNITLDEGFQSLSSSQISGMTKCTTGSTGCAYIQYYDKNSKLQSEHYLLSTIPNKMYLDACNILQPVPYGNIVNPDYRGYTSDHSYNSTTYSSAAHLSDNAISNPTKCDPKTPSAYSPKLCYDVSYITMNGNTPVFNNGNIIIPDGYYNNSGTLTIVPYGYTVSPDKKSIIINIDFSNQISGTSYNTNNYDITYHVDASNGSPDIGSAGSGKMWVLDQCGNLISIPYSDISGTTLYNEPGSFRFGSSNYVPNYEESVYLSKLTNISTVSPVINSAANAAGFCSALYPDRNALEQACNALDKNACASTSCCALLGGQKCVYGNENGPYFKSNYSNFQITNPEFYYYQGKCYGKCSV